MIISSSFTLLLPQENKRSSQLPVSMNTLEATAEISVNTKHSFTKVLSSTELSRTSEERGDALTLNLGAIIEFNLYNKYEKEIQNTYNINIANDLVLNSNSHIVATFKDYLVYDDLIENIKEFYTYSEACQKFNEFVTSTKEKAVIPNYAVIEENKFIFKNLKKKAKKKLVVAQPNNNRNGSIIFTKGLMDELVKRTTNIPVRNLNKLTMVDLIDKFIDRDTLSLINNTNCTNVKVPFPISIPITKLKPPGPKSKPSKIVPLPNPLRKGVGRLSPISRSKAKVRHVSQECIKDYAKMKGENHNRNNGRMTAIGHYPVKENKVSKKILGEAKQAKVASVKLIKVKDELKSTKTGKMKITKVCIASSIALNSIKKMSKATKEFQKKGSESIKGRTKENITIKINAQKNIKPLQAQHENRSNTATSKLPLRNSNKKPSKKAHLVITPKSNNPVKVTFPVSVKDKPETNIRAVSALGNNPKKKT